jgi:ABC-type nitrate/sulfonate/bicarbonate transport system substrate-binding protein
MNKRTFLGLLAGSATAAVLAADARARADDTPVIRLAALATDVAGEAIYGVDSGIFARAGLHVDLALFTNYGAIQSALVSHATDVAVFDTLGFAVTVSHDVPIQIIGASANYNTKTPTLLMCVAAKSPLRTPADLTGKTIAVGTLRGSADVSTRAWLAQNKVDGTSVKIIELPFPEMGPALDRGTIDAATIVEPYLNAALQAGARPFGKIYDAIAPHYAETLWATNADYAQQNPELVKRLMNGMYDVARWANANHAQTAQLLVKRAKLDEKTVAMMTRAEYATSLDPKLIQPVFDRALAYGVITKPLLAQTVIAPSFRA